MQIVDGTFHEVDSSELAFKMAGIFALKDAAKKANPILLEPVMKVEVITPEANMGDVIGDLNSKRAQINEMTDRLHLKVIDAQVPLSETPSPTRPPIVDRQCGAAVLIGHTLSLRHANFRNIDDV